MTNKQLMQIAMRQSAIDSNCHAQDFEAVENKVVISRAHPDARRYLKLPFDCDLTSYGGNLVASVSEELSEVVREYIASYPFVRCFETPNLLVLAEKLKPFDKTVCFMATYYLPDLHSLKARDCGYTVSVLRPEDFAPYYLPQWSNALCEGRKHLDKIAVGAFEGEKLIGLAGCSADCDTMYQIGIDVLPEYRRQGIASCLTSRLALEILALERVPFYCCAWSNIKSMRNAAASGFRPAWVQLTVKDTDFAAALIR